MIYYAKGNQLHHNTMIKRWKLHFFKGWAVTQRSEQVFYFLLNGAVMYNILCKRSGLILSLDFSCQIYTFHFIQFFLKKKIFDFRRRVKSAKDKMLINFYFLKNRIIIWVSQALGPKRRELRMSTFMERRKRSERYGKFPYFI